MIENNSTRKIFEFSYQYGLREFSKQSQISITYINKIRNFYKEKGIIPLIDKNKNYCK